MPAGGTRAKSESGSLRPGHFLRERERRAVARGVHEDEPFHLARSRREERDRFRIPAGARRQRELGQAGVPRGGARRVAREERLGRLQEHERQACDLLGAQRPHDELPVRRDELAAGLAVEREDLSLRPVVIEAHAVRRLQDESPGLGRGFREAGRRVRLHERAADGGRGGIGFSDARENRSRVERRGRRRRGVAAGFAGRASKAKRKKDRRKQRAARRDSARFARRASKGEWAGDPLLLRPRPRAGVFTF